jgi:glycosyltransferase involved in cell wall biosynthesis
MSGMNNPKVSIIVPVYNLENYIEQSVRSLLTQFYQDIEIILVDDGSKDASLSIIEQLAASDSRIVYTSQPNGGAAKARNTGLALATGDFITFVDGDDMLSPNAIRDNIGYFDDEKIDWVAFSVRRVDAQGNYIQTKGVYEDFIVSSYESITSEAFVPYFYSRKLSGVACAAIYRKSSIASISFTEGKYYEDSIYFIDLLCNTKNAILSPKGEYLYVDRDGSSQKAALDYRHLDSSWYAHKKRMTQYRELFPQYESSYSNEESSFYYFLKNEVAKGNIAAKEVLTLFLRELRTKPKKNYAKEVKFLIYRVVGYRRIKKVFSFLIGR